MFYVSLMKPQIWKQRCFAFAKNNWRVFIALV